MNGTISKRSSFIPSSVFGERKKVFLDLRRKFSMKELQSKNRTMESTWNKRADTESTSRYKKGSLEYLQKFLVSIHLIKFLCKLSRGCFKPYEHFLNFKTGELLAHPFMTYAITSRHNLKTAHHESNLTF